MPQSSRRLQGLTVEEYQPKPRGRPKDQQRRARIVESAMKLFLEHGMQAVSIEVIASHAGVSNRTVYSHFATKQDLLWAVIVQASESMRPMIQGSETLTLAELRNQLIEFGVALVSLLTTPTIVKLGNLMLSEAARHPDLAKQFYDWGPRSGQLALAQLLESAKQRKLIAEDASPQMSHHLLAMFQGTWHHEQQLGISKPMTKPAIKKHVIECVDFFLRSIT
ncbi:MAG: TetR/AcrR family transcriptional regulator [Pirellulaceae bacterium]|nr:TetR/AcrR family transcriptional regulator [Pirellulaceae bacterium]